MGTLSAHSAVLPVGPMEHGGATAASSPTAVRLSSNRARFHMVHRRHLRDAAMHHRRVQYARRWKGVSPFAPIEPHSLLSLTSDSRDPIELAAAREVTCRRPFAGITGAVSPTKWVPRLKGADESGRFPEGGRMLEPLAELDDDRGWMAV